MSLTKATSRVIADNTITDLQIASNAAITGSKLADNTITNLQIASNAAIAGTKIAADFGSQDVVVSNTWSFGGRNSAGTRDSYFIPNWSDNWSYLNHGANGMRIRLPNDTAQVTIDASGNVSVRNNITAFTSDERLKTNFKIITKPLEKLKEISGYEFDWLKVKCDSIDFKPELSHEHGVKAQEIQRVIPDAVCLAPADTVIDKNNKKVSKSGENYLTVKYDKIIPLLIEAVKELSKEVEVLKQKINS
jgi:hypothetical protein